MTGNPATVESTTDKKRAFFKKGFVGTATENRRTIWLAFILFWSIVMWYFFKAFVVSGVIVADASMHPTLPKGGYYLVNRYIYYFVRPERGDLVVFLRNTNIPEEDVKRVVGLPGETLQIKSSRVYINGRPLDEPYAAGGTYPDFGPYTIGEEVYFVLGDTRWVREDSRDYGPVSLKNISGKITPYRLFPFR